MEVPKFYCVNLGQKMQSLHILTIFFLNIIIIENSTGSLHNIFLSTCFCDRSCFSLTEAFVGGGKLISDGCVFLGQKTWKKLVSVMETFFLRKIFSLVKLFFLKEFSH